jgi:L-fuconolactonase
LTEPAQSDLRIDAHHHLWAYNPHEYDWLEGELAALQRDFTVTDLQHAMSTAGVHGAIAVQARQTVAETRWLLQQATPSSGILGVVGWLPIADEAFSSYLDEFTQATTLKGLRHVVQGEGPGFLDQPAFRRGISHLAARTLTYDILIHAPQLPEATRFVDAFPHQHFILDHLGKPDIRNSGFAAWAPHFRELAERDHVTVKLSGLITQADPHAWHAAQLNPYIDLALDAFGPNRIMIGTDWPVLTAGCTYSRWWQMVDDWLSPLRPAERAAILGGTAASIYRLTPPAHEGAP